MSTASASAAVLDIEITRKFPELNSLGDVDGALVLFRLHGRPLGWGAAAVTAGRLDTPALIRQLLDQHAWSCALALTERALQNGAPPRTLDLTGMLQSPPQEPASGPLVTVAVCNTTPAARLEACLESLQRLDYAPLDLVVIDASDDRKRVERMVKDRFPHVRYASAPGAGAVVQCAVAECRGDILAITDGDAIVDARWVSKLAHIFLSDPDVMTVSGLALPRSIQKPFRATLPAGAPFCREWSRVHLDAGAKDASMQRVLSTGSANIAIWRPGRAVSSSYTHVFEPAAIVRSQSSTLTHPPAARLVSLREADRSVDLADRLVAIDDAASFDGLSVHVSWLGRAIGDVHIAHRGATVSPLWMADAIAQQLTAEILDARLGIGEHVCRALLTADLARFILSRTPLSVPRSVGGARKRTPSAA
jgi:glycosyltransferase involved in cell wall biosynthesis